ncbi:unnamed protein product [Meganyctiphanes norvegica]|uniref:C-type lectin domain-containing protein n=1 Tax=Meganyctiphanes norvegica TaxID=48144 RepID=A0AAV2SA67_MEGNR
MWCYGLLITVLVTSSHQQDLDSQALLANMVRLVDSRMETLDMRMNHIGSQLNNLFAKEDSSNEELMVKLSTHLEEKLSVLEDSLLNHLEKLSNQMEDKISVFEEKISNQMEDKISVLEEKLSNLLEEKVYVIEEKLPNHMDDQLYNTVDTIDQINSTIGSTVSIQVSNKHEILGKLSDLGNKQSDFIENALSGENTTLSQIQYTSEDIEDKLVSIKNITEKLELEAVAFRECSSSSKTLQENTLQEVNDMKSNIASMEYNIIEAINSTSALPQKEIGCTESMGFFTLPGSSQCYKWFSVGRTFEEADANCKAEGLLFAKPKNAVALRNYLFEKYGDEYYLLGARGEPTGYKWLRDGSYLMPSSPLWVKIAYRTSSDSIYCLALCAVDYYMKNDPASPYLIME